MSGEPGRQSVVAVLGNSADFLYLRESLASDGVVVIHTPCLEEALQTTAPVILYDADGPQGWTAALRQIGEMRPQVRIVVLSRIADDRMWIEVLSQGAYDLLPKPFQTSEIRGVVLGALETRMNLATAAIA